MPSALPVETVVEQSEPGGVHVDEDAFLFERREIERQALDFFRRASRFLGNLRGVLFRTALELPDVIFLCRRRSFFRLAERGLSW